MKDKMTDNQMCRVEQTWQQSQNLLTLVGSLKTEACLIWKPFQGNIKLIQSVFPQMDKQQSSTKTSGLLSSEELSVDRTTCKII